MEQQLSRISDAEYLQEITDFSMMYVDHHRGEIFAGIAGRIGLALGMDKRLETDELLAVWKGVERRYGLLLPVPEQRSGNKE